MEASLNLPPTIRFERRGAIAIITLNRPEALNAFDREMLTGLEAAFDHFKMDPGLRVAILTGAGERSFCTGMDLKSNKPTEMGIGNRDPAKRHFSDIFKPIIGAVNGYCIAGGLEMLQGTDIRIAATNAKFGLGEVRWGIVPGGGSHVRLPDQIPWAVAMEILLMGRPILASRAYEIGLVNEVVAPELLMPTALKWADVIALNGPLAVQTAKEIAVRGRQLEGAFIVESLMSPRANNSEDMKEGIAAFAEKRTPDFRGL